MANSKAKKATEPVESGTVTEESADGNATVFGVQKGTAEINVFTREWATRDLKTDFSEDYINSLYAGQKKSLASKDYVYSMDRDVLEKHVVSKGWGGGTIGTAVVEESFDPAPAAPVEQTVEDSTIDNPTLEDARTPEPETHYELDETAQFDETTNAILKLHVEQDTAFVESLNKKEGALLDAFATGRKFPTGLSATDQKLWKSIQDKYAESLNPPADTDDEQEPIENFQKNPGALVKADPDAIDGEIELPLTDQEKQRLGELETDIAQAKSIVDQGPRAVQTMMLGFSEIRQGRLYRDTHDSIEAYAEERFGITRQYAQNLMQYGDYLTVLNEGAMTKQIATSVNTVKALVHDTNRIAAELGVDKSDFEQLAPIIKNVAQIVYDISTNEAGETNVTPQIIQNVGAVVNSVVRQGVVEIDGVQMSIEEAQKKGVLGMAVKSEIVETIAEQILTKKQIITDEAKEKRQNRFAAHPPAEPKTKADEYTGEIPIYAILCSLHKKFKANYVVNVFNAGFETACGCKFQKLTTSDGLFVCVEVEGKTVNHK